MSAITPLTPLPPPTVGEEADRMANLEENRLFCLPGELQSRLCKRLFDEDIDSLSAFFRTCRAIHTLWRRDFLERYDTSIEKRIGALLEIRARRVVVWHIFGHEEMPNGIANLLGQLTFHDTAGGRRLFDCLPRLLCRELSLSCLEDTQHMVGDMVSRYPPFLKDLRIQSRHLTDVYLEEIATRCPELTQLELMDCQEVRFSGTCSWKSLTAIAFKDCPGICNEESFKNIVKRCPKLSGLAVISSSDQGVITQAALMALADSDVPEPRAHLGRLALPGCRDIDGAALAAFIKKCPSIYRITLTGRGLPTLRDGITLLLDFPTLSHLGICRSEDKALSLFDESMRHLLHQVHIPAIPDLAWACAMMGLQDMDLVEALVLCGYERCSQFSQEEKAKMAWACKRWNVSWPSSAGGQALDKQNGPECGPEARKLAIELLKTFLEYLPKGT